MGAEKINLINQDLGSESDQQNGEGEEKKEKAENSLQSTQNPTISEASHSILANEDIVFQIFQFLDGTNLVKIASTCKIWNKVAQSNVLWKSLFLNGWKSMSSERFQWFSVAFIDESTKENNWKKSFILQHRMDLVSARASLLDVDKAGESVEYLIAKHLNKHDPTDLYPSAPLENILEQTTAGEDVCYGPVSLVSSSKVKLLAELLEDVTADDLMEHLKPDEDGFPNLLGALEISTEYNYC